MNTLYKISFTALSLIIVLTNAQAQNKALLRGDTVPDIPFSKAFNYKTGKKVPFKLSDYRGKMIILDFWNPWCIPCVRAFPHLDSMQKEFTDQIKIVTVTLDKEEKITEYFRTFKNIHCPDMPAITGDTILHQLFPHTGVPFQVWIDKDGKVSQLVSDIEFDKKNLEKVLSDNNVQLRQAKKNKYPNTTIDDRWKNEVEFASVLIREKWSNGLHIEGRENKKGYTEVGSIAQLYQRAYDGLTGNKLELYRPGRLVLDVPDTLRYINPYRGEKSVQWADKNVYHYELCLPDNFTGNCFELMKQDLDRYFHLKTKIEKRQVQVLALIRTSTKDKLKTTGQPSFDDFKSATTKFFIDTKKRRLINKPFSSLTGNLQGYLEYQFNIPFWDATGYEGNIDIAFPGSALDNFSIPAFKKALQKYDLDLVWKPREMDILMISE
jgi:thiol-disulfide isomerase/thioredoxin